MSRSIYQPGPTPTSDDPRVLREWISRELLRIAETQKPLEAQYAWDPGSIANNAEEELDVDFVGAALGDVAVASFSLDLQGLILQAEVTAKDTITLVLLNNSGSPVDLSAGTATVRLL